MQSKSRSTRRIKRTPPGPTANVAFAAAMKAGIFGGITVSGLYILSQLSFFSATMAAFLIPPVMVIVWIVTGIAAGMLADKNRYGFNAAGTGATSGLIAGVFSGVTSMITAALGQSFSGLGDGFLRQFTDTQLTNLMASGFSAELVITAGNVLGDMFVCGLGGMFAAALFGGFGGWLYPKFSQTQSKRRAAK